MDRESSVAPGGRAVQDRREGVQGVEGGDRQVGGLHQRSVLHPGLVAHQVHIWYNLVHIWYILGTIWYISGAYLVHFGTYLVQFGTICYIFGLPSGTYSGAWLRTSWPPSTGTPGWASSPPLGMG